MLDYSTVEKWIKDCPMTMAVGIFIAAAKHGWKKGCFKSGGMAHICERIEEESVKTSGNKVCTAIEKREAELAAQTITLTCGKCYREIRGRYSDVHSKCLCGGLFHKL